MQPGEEERRALLHRLLKTTRAADQLARRRFSAESARLYEDVVSSLSNTDRRDCPEVRSFLATRRSVPPPNGRAQSDGERLADLRADVAAGLRAHWADLIAAGDRFSRTSRRVAAGVLAVALVVMVLRLGYSLTRHDLSEGAKWEASSTSQGAKRRGVFAKVTAFSDVPNFFCHTDEEQNPHVDIDLGRLHVVDSVDITNRLDCCTDRARKLELWLAREPGKFERVAVRNAKEGSRSFTIDADAREARFVRIAVPGKGILHLARVRVFGR